MNEVVLPVVAVQLAEPPTEYTAEIIEACTATLRQGRGELAPVAGESSTAVAIVSWIDTQRTEVLVESADGQTEADAECRGPSSSPTSIPNWNAGAW